MEIQTARITLRMMNQQPVTSASVQTEEEMVFEPDNENSGSEPEDCTPNTSNTTAKTTNSANSATVNSVNLVSTNNPSETDPNEPSVLHLLHHDYTEQPGAPVSPGPSSEPFPGPSSGPPLNQNRPHGNKFHHAPTCSSNRNFCQIVSPPNVKQLDLKRLGFRGFKKSKSKRHASDRDNTETERTRGEDPQQNELNQKLLRVLECPVCMEHIRPPVVQCLNGHLICQACRKRVVTCPTCRARFSDLHNFAMEVVAKDVEYPCCNSAAGCSVTLKPHEQSEHESGCKFRLFDCHIDNCQWGGLHADYMYHTVKKHPEMFMYGFNVVLTLPISNLKSINWIVAAHNEIFRVNFSTRDGNTLYGCVQLVGASKRAHNFQYTLKLPESPQKKTRSQLIFTRAVHEYTRECDDIYMGGDGISIFEKTAVAFSSGSAGNYFIPMRLQIELHNA